MDNSVAAQNGIDNMLLANDVTVILCIVDTARQYCFDGSLSMSYGSFHPDNVFVYSVLFLTWIESINKQQQGMTSQSVAVMS